MLRWLFAATNCPIISSVEVVQLLPGSAPCIERAPQETRTASPAELADILEDLSSGDRSAIFTPSTPKPRRTPWRKSTTPSCRQALIETVTDEKASDIIEEMSVGRRGRPAGGPA